jgi:hypothetical protein
MRTIKSIPTVILAVSLGAGIIPLSEVAFARDGVHQGHNDHQDHSDRPNRNAERSTPQGGHFGGIGKSDKGNVNATRTGTGQVPTISLPTHGGNPPRGPVATTNGPPPAPGTGGTNTIHPIPGPAPTTNLPPPTHGGNPPRGPVGEAPGGPAVVSNGQVKLYIPNSPSGLSVTSNKSGTITVSNGDPTHSVTLPGGSVTISGGGVTSVGGAPGVQVITHPNGDFVAAATTPAKPVPAPAPPVPGHVTGGPEGGFLNALGSGLKDLVDPSFTVKVPTENVKPPLATSTTTQQ